MNKILNGGLSTKNTPPYTMDSFLLSLKKDNLSGIIVDAYLTKDNKLVLLNERISTILGLDEYKIKKMNYRNIKNIYYGTKIKGHYLVELQDLIKIYNKDLYLVVNLCNKDISKNEFNLLNSLFLSINYDKLVISSKSVDDLNKLDNSLNKGLYVTNNKDWQYSFKYYIANEKNINNEIINELEKNGSIIFLYK